MSEYPSGGVIGPRDDDDLIPFLLSGCTYSLVYDEAALGKRAFAALNEEFKDE